MTIEQLLAQMDMGDVDQAERRRRVGGCLNALNAGHKVCGVIGDKVTVVRRRGDVYKIKQKWTIKKEAA